MTDALRLAGYREPLGLWMRRTPVRPEDPALRAHELELSSRGDRVTGQLLLPAKSPEGCPLVVLQDDLPAGSEARRARAGAWAREGAAVACVDLPLHGARADRKLLAHLPRREAEPGSNEGQLAIELARQAVIDLERTLDALLALPEIDPERVVFMGTRLGAVVGAAFCALDPRPRAAVLVECTSGLGLADLEAVHYVGRVAPRPLLFIGARGDARTAAEAPFAAAGSPKEQIWLDAEPGTLDAAAAEAAWPFLARHLEVGPRAPAR